MAHQIPLKIITSPSYLPTFQLSTCEWIECMGEGFEGLKTKKKQYMKELKDYLHLYLGCEVMTPDGIRPLIGMGIMGLVYVRTFPPEISPSTAYFTYHASVVTPILRPLSDMTEEECITANSLSLDGALDGDSNIKHYYHRQAVFFEPKEFVFLLSIGIDLFGLIEAGLAADKTTLTQITK